MFSEINGLPVHALAVHGAVVAIPLAALLAVLFVVPRTRAWARLPMALVSVGALGALFVAKQSGESLEGSLESQGELSSQNPATAIVRLHSDRANVLWLVMIGFTVVAVAAYVLSLNAERFHGALALGTSALLIVAAAAVSFETYLVGDAGAKAVWNPTGKTDFSSSSDPGSDAASDPVSAGEPTHLVTPEF